MAYCVNPWRWGAAHVHWAWGSFTNCTLAYGAESYIGLSEKGPDITIESRFAPVQGDDFGGPEGEAADEQFMGAAAVIDLAINRVNGDAALEILREILSLNAAQAGVFPAMGSFVKLDGLFGRLYFKCSKASLYFPIARPIRQAFNVGTKAETSRVAFRGLLDTACSRTLYVIAAGVDPCT